MTNDELKDIWEEAILISLFHSLSHRKTKKVPGIKRKNT